MIINGYTPKYVKKNDRAGKRNRQIRSYSRNFNTPT